MFEGIKYIIYNNQEIEVPKGISIPAVIKIIKCFYPEITRLDYYREGNKLKFRNFKESKAAHIKSDEVLKSILDFGRSDNPAAFSYHEVPNTQAPEPVSTIPQGENINQFFLHGERTTGNGSGNGNFEGGANLPRIVGGDITEEARKDAKNQTITVIGDSLGVGTESPLRQMGWKKDNYNVKGSRQWKHADIAYSALDQLSSMKNSLNDVVIFILGTNRGVEDSEIKEAVDMVGSNKQILLINTASEVSHADDVASKYDAAAVEYSNVFYGDWKSFVGDKVSTWYSPDGAGGTHIHMTPEGYKKHAEFITQAVYEIKNTDWSAGGDFSLGQPTAKKYDKSRANLSGETVTGLAAQWNQSWIDQFRAEAADPPYITGDYINKWIKIEREGAKLLGHGNLIKLYADYYGIAVGLALGMWLKETQLGKTKCGGIYNFGCRKWSKGNPHKKITEKNKNVSTGEEQINDWQDPASIEIAIADWFKYIRYRYVEQGMKTYGQLLDTYSPKYDNNQATFKNVCYGVVKSLGYDISDKVTKRNFGSPNDDITSSAFFAQVKEKATPKPQNNGGRGGGTTTGAGRFSHFPTTPSKSQINYGFSDPAYTALIGRSHSGMDIIYTDGTKNIYAVADGVVKTNHTGCVVGDKQCGGAYGNHIEIDHNNGYSSVYAHLAESRVRQGQAVKGGDLIGIMGTTGLSTGVHLHFEIKQSGKKINPESVMTFTGYKRLT